MTHPLLAEVRTQLQQPQLLWINGKQQPSRTGKLLDILEPSTGKVLTQVHAAQKPDVDEAVTAARSALKGPWSTMNAEQRTRIVWKIGDLLDAQAERLGLIECLNNGKTLREGVGDVEPSADAFRYYASCIRNLGGRSIPMDPGQLLYTIRQPVGVCAQITPWNYPLLMAAWKIAPALASGCTVVHKPSEWTPLTALALGQICKEAGVPDGVVNIVPGLGPETGAALSAHPLVDKIAFTGSVETARALLHASADSNLKKISLELGGKSPLLVFEDADLEQAVHAAFWGIFANKGEVCSASSRVLVHRAVQQKFVDMLRVKAEAMKVGPSLQPDVEMGALVHPKQMSKVLGYIESGKKQGATLVCGGQRVNVDGYPDGLYLRPTIFDNVSPEMDIATEEIFGPVLSVISFESEEQAVELANNTTYGLVAAVFTRDVGCAHRVAHAVQAGVVWINRWNGFDSAAPFGGVKQSGWGRELGTEALDLYTQTKCIWTKIG